MVADYERAWVRLQALVASKPQHGREPTLKAMAEILEECRVPAGELSRLLRLYGVEVERARSLTTESDPAVVPVSSGESLSERSGNGAGHHRPGGHDGSRVRYEAGTVGANA